jgi:hypothetical protein
MRIKLFENFKNVELLQNVKDCFQELIDDDIAYIPEDAPDDFESIIISLTIPKAESQGFVMSNTFEEFFQKKEKEFKLISEINNCIERLKKQHDETIDTNCEIYDGNNGNLQIDIEISEGEPEIGEFWKIGKNGTIRLDYQKLKKYLNIPSDVRISISSGGTKVKYLSFHFKNDEEFESNKESLIKNISDIKINGVELTSDHEWVYPSNGKSRYQIQKKYDKISRRQVYDYISFFLNPELNFNW